MKLIDNHIKNIVSLCKIKNIVSLCKRYKVNRLFVFGSVLTDRFNDDSDIDLVVDFKKDEVEDYFDNYFDFKYSLQDLFGRKVDLVEEQSIKNPYFRNLEYCYQPPAETERRSTGSTGTIDILNNAPSCSNVGGFVVYSGFYSLDIPADYSKKVENRVGNNTLLTIPTLH